MIYCSAARIYSASYKHLPEGYLREVQICSYRSLTIVSARHTPRQRILGYKIVRRPIIEPGFKTQLQPMSAWSPMTAPNFRNPVSLSSTRTFPVTDFGFASASLALANELPGHNHTGLDGAAD